MHRATPPPLTGCPTGCPLDHHEPECVLGGRDFHPRGLTDYDASAVYSTAGGTPWLRSLADEQADHATLAEIPPKAPTAQRLRWAS